MKFTIPLKPCGCGVLLGEVCDCAQFAAEAAQLFETNPLTLTAGTPTAPKPASTTYPTPLILRNVGGLLLRADDQR